MALLDIQSLHLEIRNGETTPILRGVNLHVNAGEVVGLVGESGAGKSMVGRVVLGQQPESALISEGSVTFDGRDLLRMDERERSDLLGKDIALIPQNPMTALNPVARIEPQIVDVLRMHTDLNKAQARERALSLLNDVHLPEPQRILRRYPHELSGGMRQRILIAIAFACRPRLIIADEPTTALDVTVQKQILRLIRELQASYGTGMLFITHDLGVVAKLCDRVSVIHAGRILESGTTKDVFEAPRNAYTQALFASTPRYDRPETVLAAIPDALTAQLWDEAHAYDEARSSS